MTVHQSPSPSWIRENYQGTIRRLSDRVSDMIAEDVEELGMELTHTCDEFNENTCTDCENTLERIQDHIKKAIFDDLMGVGQ